MAFSLGFTQAIIVTIYVGDKVAQGMFDFVPTKAISEALNIARPSAVKILGSLASAGIVETREGARGGVRLARPADSISVLDIFNAIETGKPMFRHDFNLAVTGAKPTRAQSAVRAVLDSAETAMHTQLAAVTVADLLGSLNADS